MREDLTGLRKSAVVLLSLGEQRASDVLERMDDVAAEAVRAEMQRIGELRRVSLETRQQALEDFCCAAAGGLMDQEESEPATAEADSESVTLADWDPSTLLEGIGDEHPQTIALVLSNLPPDQAGEVLAGLEPRRKLDVIKRIAQIEQTSSSVIEQVERSLRDRLQSMMGRTVRSAGVTAVAQILNFADRKIEEQILADLRLEAPDLVDQIRRLQRIFDDLLVASDEDLQLVIEQVDDETIALSLRMVGDRLKQRVLSVMSLEQAEQMERRMQQGLAVSVAEIEAAQQRVAEVVHRLDAAGEIEVLSDGPAERRGLEGKRV